MISKVQVVLSVQALAASVAPTYLDIGSAQVAGSAVRIIGMMQCSVTATWSHLPTHPKNHLMTVDTPVDCGDIW